MWFWLRKNSDGFTFDSDEHTDVLVVLLLNVLDGDGGVSVIDGESANGPTRRAAFGGGLKWKITLNILRCIDRNRI